MTKKNLSIEEIFNTPRVTVKGEQPPQLSAPVAHKITPTTLPERSVVLAISEHGQQARLNMLDEDNRQFRHTTLLDSLPPPLSSLRLTPLFTVEFDYLLSMNDVFTGVSRFTVRNSSDKWKTKGYKAALEVARAMRVVPVGVERYEVKRGVFKDIERLTHPVIAQAVELRVSVWRPDNARYDITNVYLKPIIDGFVKAGVMADDDSRVIMRQTIDFKGVDTSLKFTKAERAERKEKRKQYLDKDKTPPRMPKRMRVIFDFIPI